MIRSPIKIKKLFKINKLTFKYNFFFKYLKLIAFYKNKKVKIYNTTVQKIKKRIKIREIRKIKYFKKKNKMQHKMLRTIYKKWWFFMKRKRKKTMQKLENTNFWISKFFFVNICKNNKFNKNIKKLGKISTYNDEFFYENFEIKKVNIKEIKFNIDDSDELFVYKNELFYIEFYTKFSAESQFFFTEHYDCINKKKLFDKTQQNCEKNKQNTTKLYIFKANRNKMNIKKIINKKIKYKLKSWL